MNKYLLKMAILFYIGFVLSCCKNSSNKNIGDKRFRHVVINGYKERGNNSITNLPSGKKIKDVDLIDICKCKTDAIDTLKRKNKEGEIFYIYRRQYTYDTIINNQYMQFCFSKEFINKQQIESNLLKNFNDAFIDFKDNITNKNEFGNYLYLYHSRIDISNSFKDSIFYDFEYSINQNSSSSMTKECRLLVPLKIINELTNETDISEEKYYKYSKYWQLH